MDGGIEHKIRQGEKEVAAVLGTERGVLAKGRE